MPLKPNNIAAKDYQVALKPTLGYEQQLYVSAQNYTNLGTISVLAPNSGVWTPNVADNAVLATAPQQLMAVLDVGADVGGATPSDLVITVTGTDQNGAALTGTATFTPPAFANDQSRAFPRGWAAEVTPATANALFKTVTAIAITSDAALATTPNILLLGVPTLDFSSTGSFHKIGTKVKLDMNPAVPVPVAVQDGRKKGAYIKPGIIDVGTLNISCKIPSPADGLARYNGQRLTGWVIEKKEDRLVTQHIFLLGLVMSATENSAEGDEPVMMDTASSLYEVYASICAH